MEKFLNRSLLIAGVSSLMSLFIGLETTQASPLCYMVDGSGQTLDLSYLCHQNATRGNAVEDRQARNGNGEEVSILGRRIDTGERNINITVELDEETLSILGRRMVSGGQITPMSRGVYSRRVSSPNALGSYTTQNTLIRRTSGLDDLSTPLKRTVGPNGLSSPFSPGSDIRNDNLIRRTGSLDAVANPVSTNISTDFPTQYVLNRAGVMEIRQSTGYVRFSRD